MLEHPTQNIELNQIRPKTPGLVTDKTNAQMLSNLIATLESTQFWPSIGPTLSQLRSIEPKLDPFLVVSLVGQHILTLNHYLESSILLDCCLQMDTDSLKLKSSVHASLAVAYWKLDNKFDLAINAMKQDLNCVIKLNDLNGQYRSLSNLALAYYQLQQFDDSLGSYLAQLDVAKLLEDKKVLESLKSIAGVHQQLKDYRKAILSYEELLSLASQENDFNSMLKALKSLSYLHLQMNDLQKAISYQEQVCRLVERVPNFSRIMPKARLELSDLYEQIGNHQKSNEILHKLSPDACAEVADQKSFELLLLEKKAAVNFELKNYQACIEMSEKLLSKLICEEEERGRKAKILNRLAECYYSLDDHSKSIRYFKQQLKLAQEESADETAKIQRLDAMKKLSVCYKKTNQLDDTLKLYFDILNYSREVADLDSQLWSFYNIGFCYYTNGVYAEAISIFLEYLALLDEMDSEEEKRKDRLKIYHVLALIHFKMSDFKEAFGYFGRDADLMEQLKEQLSDLNPNIDLGQLANSEGNELLVCTKICCLLISPKASSTVDDILNSFAELTIS